MKTHKLFLMFCMLGLCLISFLHFFKTLSCHLSPRTGLSQPNPGVQLLLEQCPGPRPRPARSRVARPAADPTLFPLTPAPAAVARAGAAGGAHRTETVLPEDTTV